MVERRRPILSTRTETPRYPMIVPSVAAHRSDNVGRHALVRNPWMDGRHIDIMRGAGWRAPQLGAEVFAYHSRVVWNRSDETTFRTGDEHAVDPRVGVECSPEPLLCGGLRV